jgi:hypothetical protein
MKCAKRVLTRPDQALADPRIPERRIHLKKRIQPSGLRKSLEKLFAAHYPAMISYPLPPQIATRKEFHELVTSLYGQLVSLGLDPGCNVAVDDYDVTLADGTIRHRFAVHISETAAQLLEKNPR